MRRGDAPPTKMSAMAQAPDDRDALVLDDGRAVLVLLDDWARFVWWGADGDVDRVATADGQVLTWATADACRRHARDSGRTAVPVKPSADVATEDTIDACPAQIWLSRLGTPPDPVAELGLEPAVGPGRHTHRRLPAPERCPSTLPRQAHRRQHSVAGRSRHLPAPVDRGRAARRREQP